MTDSSDPKAPKNSRKKRSREPATIDLKATVVHEGARQDKAGDKAGDKAWDAVKPEETIVPEADVPAVGTPADETLGAEKSLDLQDIPAAQDALAGQTTLGPEMPLTAQDTLGGQDTVGGQDILGTQEPLAQEPLAQEPLAQEPLAQEPLGARDTLEARETTAAENGTAARDATLDSGLGADAIAANAAAGEGPPPPDAPRDLPPGPAPAPERRGSAAAVIGSGLLGGLIGAGLVYGLGQWQQPPAAPQDPRVAQLEQRVNALSQSRPAAQPGSQNVDLSPIEGRIQALEEARAPLDQRLQEIQEAANRAAAQAAEALNRPQPEPAAPPPPQNDAALAELSKGLADLSTRVGALENPARIEALENTVRALEGNVRTGAQSAAEASNAVQDLNRRLGEQDQRLAALSQQVAENGRSVETAGQASTRVVLTERLGDALRNGTPYAPVLDALRKTGIDAERLKPLEPFAEKGAPTAAALSAGFEPLQAQILRDQRAASGEWSDRVLRMLDNVVTVRPVNEPDSAGVPGTVARIRQALASDDVAQAAAAWSSLPEPARRISEEWGRQVQALAEARQASRDLSGDALATLNRSTQ